MNLDIGLVPPRPGCRPNSRRGQSHFRVPAMSGVASPAPGREGADASLGRGARTGKGLDHHCCPKLAQPQSGKSQSLTVHSIHSTDVYHVLTVS